MWDDHLGCITAVKHGIELTNNPTKTIHAAPYREGPETREFENAETDNILEQWGDEPAQTKKAPLFIFEPKKDEAFRFSVDYRNLKAVTMRVSYPILRMNECIDSLNDAAIFFTLDVRSGYLQIGIGDSDQIRNRIQISSRALPIHSHAIQTLRCTSHLPENYGCLFSNRKMAVYIGLFGRRSYTF